MKNFCIAALLLSFATVSAEAQQMICLEADQVKRVMDKAKEEMVFSGMSLQNSPIVVYAGKESYSIFIVSEDNKFCTGPALNGVVFKLNLGIPL